MLSKLGAHYTDRGTGPPVVLLHGNGASLHDWIYLAPSLERAGYRVLAVDLLGHGDSPKPAAPEAYHVDAISEHMLRWLEGRHTQEPLVLVGHSLGGYLALEYSLRWPGRVRGLVLVNPLVSPEQFSPFVQWVQRRPELGARVLQLTPPWMINAVLGWVPSDATSAPGLVRQQIAKDFKRASPQVLNIPGSIQDLTPRISAVRSPALVIWGKNDRTLLPDSFPKVTEAIPNALGRGLECCGHQPHLGDPDTFNRLVLAFLGDLQT